MDVPTNVVIAIPARMSSVLRQAVLAEMRQRFPRLTVALEEQAVLIPRCARLATRVDSSAESGGFLEASPSAITRYLARKFPLLLVNPSLSWTKAI